MRKLLTALARKLRLCRREALGGNFVRFGPCAGFCESFHGATIWTWKDAAAQEYCIFAGMPNWETSLTPLTDTISLSVDEANPAPPSVSEERDTEAAWFYCI